MGMKKLLKQLLFVLALAGVMTFTSSCNMLRGAGQDIGDAGDAVRDATN